MKSLSGAAGLPSWRLATCPLNACGETGDVAQLSVSGASATGTVKSSVVESPVGSVTTTCPVWVPSSAKVCCTLSPLAVPPSSNVQSKVRPSVPHGLRLPPGPVPVTPSWIGLPSVPSVGIVSIPTVGAVSFGSRLPRSTFWAGALSEIVLNVTGDRVNTLGMSNGPTVKRWMSGNGGTSRMYASPWTATPKPSDTVPLTWLDSVPIA